MNLMKTIRLLSTCTLLAFAAISAAAPRDVESKAAVVKALAEKLKVAEKDLRESPIPGVYELVNSNGRIGYVSRDGRYYLRGDLVDLDTRTSLTEQRSQMLREQALRDIDDSQTIIFPAANPKYTVTVFTDVECTYCRKFHSEIAKYNDAGITVRYLAFPREGPNTDDWRKMEQVWCAADRRDALTHAKLGKEVGKNCDKAPDINSQFQLGIRLGMDGTPGVFTPDGRMVGGYVSVERLLAELKKPATQAEVAKTAAAK